MNPTSGTQPQQDSTQQVVPQTQPQPQPQQPVGASMGGGLPQAAQSQQAQQQPVVGGGGGTVRPQPQQPVEDVVIPQLDDSFLQSIGLGVLPDVERSEMLQQMRKTLESNVGMEIYKNLQEYQLVEFEGFMPLNDENGQVVNSPEDANANAQKWLDVNVPTWRTNPDLQGMLQNPTQIQNFAAMNWLQKNFPGYKKVVSAEMTKLMTEVRNNVPQIIEAVMGPNQASVQSGAVGPSQTIPQPTEQVPQPQQPSQPQNNPTQQPVPPAANV